MKRKATRNILEASEWYFLNCPKEELLACCYYEFARSSSTTTEAILNATPEAVDYMHLYPSPRFAAALTRSFPATPWLNIAESERKILLKRFSVEAAKHDLIFTRLAPEWDEDTWKPVFPEYGTYLVTGDNVTAAVFNIRWEQSNDELKAAFQRFLQQYRPTGARPKKGRVGNVADYLNALGAKRMMAHCASMGLRPVAQSAHLEMKAQASILDPEKGAPYTGPKQLALAAERADKYSTWLYDTDGRRKVILGNLEIAPAWMPGVYLYDPRLEDAPEKEY